MPVIDFDQSNKVATTNFDYPKLKLKNGERARIVLLESPSVEYVHTLQKPQIINGVPQMVTEKRKDGTEYQDYKKDFMARPLCLGDFATLQKDGADPTNCPICALAKEHPDWVKNPQRRYAMHVIKYKTKTDGTLQTPYSVEVVVWSFTDRIFNQIIDFKEEWGDLRSHDLLLGPCENETFQKFEINVGAKAAWLEDDSRKALTAETFKENKIPDISIAIGAKKEVRWVNEDLAAITQAWTLIAGATTVDTEVLGGSSLSQDLSSLLDDGPATPVAAAPAAEVAAPAAAPVEAAPAAAEAPAAPSEPAAPATDFDDLLAGL